MTTRAHPQTTFAVFVVVAIASSAGAADYEVGPDAGMLAAIGDVPWESLQPGDRVLIHWRPDPYREKWVLCRQGTEADPIVVSGVPGPSGQLPVIDGRDATTRLALDYWNESRGVLKIGGANTPPDTLPSHIVVENLDLRSGRPPYSFTNADGDPESYASNAAAIYVEKAEHLTIRNCVLSDSGNGLFIGSYDGQTRDILIDGNWIHGNGIESSAYQHNTYTSAIGITYQRNHMGRLRESCDGNNLKDRSAGLIVRYNWIEDGNRQLDLVDAADGSAVATHPDYGTTHVYGNVLVEGDLEGNSQIIHYGGDSGATGGYRKGTLHFFHNTMVSTRSGNTTLVRLSTDDEHADVRDNILFTTASGSHLAMLVTAGVLELRDNWLRESWVNSHSGPGGTVIDHGTNITGADPGFADFASHDFSPATGSSCVDRGGALHPTVLPDHLPTWQYVRHRRSTLRPDDGAPDLGAFESGVVFVDDFEAGTTSSWFRVVP
jgi:hypothetical protein